MARASTPTLLSLDKYAALMGLDPLHFNGGYSGIRQPLCADVWKQYDWQDADKVSREQLAFKIAEAESDLAHALGFWPAPRWIEDERQAYPSPRPTGYIGVSGRDARQRAKSVVLDWGEIIEGGQRATTLLGTTDFTTADYDGDTFDETAIFTLTVDADLSVCEVHGFYKEYLLADAVNCRIDPASEGADEDWEIHELRPVLSGTTLTVYVPVWNLFRPQLQEGVVNENIDADAAASYVDEIMFYRVYNDPETQVQFLWGEDISCQDLTCAWATQAGCFRTKRRPQGIVVPSPGTYSAGSFSEAAWAQTYEPDVVRFWYRSGYQPLRARGCEVLDHWWAQTIMILATARLDMPICDNCSQAATTLADRWREDLAALTESKSFQIGGDALDNPFGTRYGEAYVWKRIKEKKRKRGRAVRF